MVELYLTAAAVVSCGAIWFYIVRPMLEDWGLLAPRDVSDNAPPAPVVMSRAAPEAASISIDTSTIPAKSEPPKAELTERAIVQWMAQQKTVDGWRWSANAIYQHMRGNRNEVMGWVREVRGGKPESPAEDDDLTLTPFAGRVTRRSFYQDDPELEYQPPA
jgi:hypothetical protein